MELARNLTTTTYTPLFCHWLGASSCPSQLEARRPSGPRPNELAVLADTARVDGGSVGLVARGGSDAGLPPDGSGCG